MPNAFFYVDQMSDKLELVVTRRQTERTSQQFI
jgi:hypothetical protein